MQETNINATPPNSLKALLDQVTGKDLDHVDYQEDEGLAEFLPYPFLAIVGQQEMKLALLLSLINPSIGGVLLIGPRGTGKTTAVRGLLELLPMIDRSLCQYGCLEKDIEGGGMDAVCPKCAKKFASDEPLSILDRARLVELPLNAAIEDVVGQISQESKGISKFQIKRGLLSQADQNVLYIDEVNLFTNEITNAIIDAASHGQYIVRRGRVSANYRARFILIGSMNPEEGKLRPQIMDRFGLRVVVQGLQNIQERQEVYKRSVIFKNNPHMMIKRYEQETAVARQEIEIARNLLPSVEMPENIAAQAIKIINQIKIASSRAEITLLETARAHAAAESRTTVTIQDIYTVAPLALRFRSSAFMNNFIKSFEKEERVIRDAINQTIPGTS